MPVVQVYLDGRADLHSDFRLSLTSVNDFIQLMRAEDHGWGRTLEVLVFVYWMAYGLSYRVTANV